MKKNLLMIIYSLLFLLIPLQVNADICSDEEIKNLTALKNKIEVKYTHLTEEEAILQYQMAHDNMYMFSFYNVPKGLVIISPYDETRITNSTNDELTNLLNTGWGFGGNTIEFPVYTSDNYHCFANLGTIKLRLAWYNKYSHNDACKKYSDFKYCKKYLNVKITEETFKKELNKYIENDNEPVAVQDENGIFSIIKDNYILIVTVIIVLILGSVIFVSLRRKRRKRL